MCPYIVPATGLQTFGEAPIYVSNVWENARFSGKGFGEGLGRSSKSELLGKLGSIK